MRSVASLTLALLTFLAALITVPAVAPAAGKAKHDRVEWSIVRAVNAQRAQHGLGAVQPSRGLRRAADRHSRAMLRGDFFAHGAFERRVRRYVSYDSIGETLAYISSCRGNAGTIVRMWMNSPGHRAILLSRSYGRIGIGRRTGRLGSTRACVVTADFASRS